MRIFKEKKRVGGVLLAVWLLLTAAGITPLPWAELPVSAAGTEGSSAADDPVEQAYYNSDYNYLRDEASVFQSITWEEAVYLFQQEGNYLILFGGSWCANTTSVIDYIDRAAKAAGVTTVYNLDFRLDGSSSNTHIRESNGSTKDGAAYNYLYGELVTRYLTNLNDWVAYTADSKDALTYTNAQGEPVTVPKVQVPFLFLYNKDNTENHAGESVPGVTYPIVYGFEEMLYRDENGGEALFTESEVQDETTVVTDYAQRLDQAIFNHIGTGEGQYALSAFTDADYIRLAYNQRAGQTVFQADEQINIRTLTYRQLVWLLQQKGTYLILFGGAWCENTQAVIRIINDYAVANHVTVYTFDTKLDGGYARDYWGYSDEVQIRDSGNLFASLYVDLVNQYLNNIQTEYAIDSGDSVYYQVDPENPATQKIASKLQVPYLLAFNKDTTDNDGHDAPILAYAEKMYVLDENSPDYIGRQENYADYTAAVFQVIAAYAQRTGETAVDVAGTEAGTDSESGNKVPPEEESGNAGGDEDSSDGVGVSDSSDSNNGSSTWRVRIIAAAVGIVVIIAVLILTAIGEKKSSGGGSCC